MPSARSSVDRERLAVNGCRRHRAAVERSEILDGETRSTTRAGATPTPKTRSSPDERHTNHEEPHTHPEGPSVGHQRGSAARTSPRTEAPTKFVMLKWSSHTTIRPSRTSKVPQTQNSIRKRR